MEDTTLANFAGTFHRCWICNRTAMQSMFGRLEIHHIARGVHRKKAKDKRSCLIRCCQPCHEKYLDGMEVVVQLAIKKMFDPEGYDRLEVNKLRRRAPEAITESEVDDALALLQIGVWPLHDKFRSHQDN